MNRQRLLSSCAYIVALPLVMGGSALAADAPPEKGPVTQLQDIVVEAHTGRSSMAGGGMIAVQDTPVVRTTIGQAFLNKQIPAQSAISSIRLAPGANVGQDNPYGMSERGDLSVRGFDQTQMGTVVEGIPAGDPNNYLPNYNEWIDGENVKSISLTQGTSDLESPVIGASGGLIDVKMRDPAQEFGGTVSVSRGSFNTTRSFVRLDLGSLWNTGILASASYSHIIGENFRGPGISRRDHFDVKMLKDLGDGSQTALVLTFNYLNNHRSSIPNLTQFQTLGKNSNFADTYTFGQTQYYKFYPFSPGNLSVGLPTKLALTSDLTLNATPYFRYRWQNGPGGSVLNTTGLFYGNQKMNETLNVPYSQNGQFTAVALAFHRAYEAGVNASFVYTRGNHQFQLGYWFDYFEEHAKNPFLAVDQNGGYPTINGKQGTIKFADGTPLWALNNTYKRLMNSFYFEDKISLLNDNLKISYGAKATLSNLSGAQYLPGATPIIGVYISNFTPRVGATYDFGEHSTLFFDLVTNARPPTAGPTYMDVFNVLTGAKVVTGNQKAKSEYTYTQEFGYRYQDAINFSIAAFHNTLLNHQVNTIIVQNGVQTQSTISAGTEEIYGVDAELGLRPYHSFSPYVSAQYLHATTESDLPVGANFLPTKGKIAVRSPKFQGAAGLTYDDGPRFAVVSARYTASQFSTFMDDQKIPAYTQVDVGFGYRFNDIAFAKRPTIQVNLINLLNKSYLGSVATPTGNAVPTIGRTGALISASQPGYYENSTFTAMVTLKTDF